MLPPPSPLTAAASSRLLLSPQQLGSFEPLQLDAPTTSRLVSLQDFSAADPIQFEVGWEMQKDIHQDQMDRLRSSAALAEVASSQFVPSENTRKEDSAASTIGCDTVVMLQHEPVYTLGTGSDAQFVKSANGKVPTVRMDRGGEVTYHGPGQLTVYPILDLRMYRQDIHWYMRALEEAVLLALQMSGVTGAERQDDTTGIWVDNHKVAAVGIKCRRWVTMHGVAINVEHKCLDDFAGIVPCGLEGRRVGCVNQFCDEPITVRDFAVHMKAALEHVFRIKLVERA